VDRLRLYRKLFRFLWFLSVNFIQQRGYNGTLGDTVCTVTMSRARHARTRCSVHSNCQRCVSCPASADRLSNPELGSTLLALHRVQCLLPRGKKLPEVDAHHISPVFQNVISSHPLFKNDGHNSYIILTILYTSYL
jgi:hypothetical protein